MLDFVQSQFIFFIAIILVLFLPGYALTMVIFGNRKILSSLERFMLSCGLSIVIVDLIAFILYRLHVPITALSSIGSLIAFIIICLIIAKFSPHRKTEEKNISPNFNFSKNQYILLCLFIFFTVFIKTLYLADTVLPTATDMGHHMYWAKWIAENGILPDYESMPDFIIGEHIIFGVIGLISKLSFFSAFPVIILHGINILSIIAVFILCLRIFKNNNIAIFAIFFLGVLYTVSSPQTKFVSGGVIGNVMGNFFLPLALFLYYRALSFLMKEAELYQKHLSESRIFVFFALLATIGLFYTHHLSALVFLLVISSSAILFLLFNFRNLPLITHRFAKIIFSSSVITPLIIGLIFFFFIFTPSYMQKSAVDTALGSPTKSTRTGLTVENLRVSLGEDRLALGVFGLILLLIYLKKNHPGHIIIVAWTGIIIIAATRPHWIFIDIPSNRIGAYLSYPMAILSAYALVKLFQNKNPAYQPRKLTKASFILLLSVAIIGGISDSVWALKDEIKHEELAQTFHASQYTASRASQQDIILKDHNYILADSWMKLFYMKGYKYPQSRGFIRRYEDPAKPREMCTLYMISSPNGKEAIDCFSETKTNIVIVNPKFDSNQFRKLKNFNQIYSSPEIAIFYRTQ